MTPFMSATTIGHYRGLGRRLQAAGAPVPMPSGGPEPIDLFVAFETYRPSAEEILDRWMRNFTGRLAKSHSPRALNLDLVLSPAEATRGGRVTIDVPVTWVCPVCGGSGVSGFYACDACEGHGMAWETARVDVLLSPPVRDGTVVPVSLRSVGVQNLYLNVHLRVAT